MSVDPTERQAIITEVRQTWDALRQAVDALAEDQLLQQRRVGDWSVKQLMAHISYWDRVAINRLQDLAEGRPEWTYDDVHAVNRDASDAAALLPLDAIREEMHATHEELMRSLETSPVLTRELVAADTYNHYPEHTEAVRQAMADVGR